MSALGGDNTDLARDYNFSLYGDSHGHGIR
ncbi:uncharacterized protein METZ01_LOCUS416150 [marine metagenome]|uniref:Uncharacterized protein n=1 Tax=marine metagenome TaxID=408172 RepID=A0A382WWK6_9ZZZZ